MSARLPHQFQTDDPEDLLHQIIFALDVAKGRSLISGEEIDERCTEICALLKAQAAEIFAHKGISAAFALAKRVQAAQRTQ